MKKLFTTTFLVLALMPIFGVTFVLAADAPETVEYELLTPLPGISSENGGAPCVTDTGKPCATASSYIPGIVKLVIALAGGLAVLKIIYGGIQYMSTDAFMQKSDAKGTISNAIWGLVLVISSVVILNTLNPKLVSFSFNIKGLETGEPFNPALGEIGGGSSSGKSGAGTTGSTGTSGSVGCTDCVTVGVRHKSPPEGCDPNPSGDCLIIPELNNRLKQLGNLYATPAWSVTEAWPPTRTHTNSCHQSGTCVDASITAASGRTASNISRFIRMASDAKLKAEYEVENTARQKELTGASGLTTSQVKVYRAPLCEPGRTGVMNKSGRYDCCPSTTLRDSPTDKSCSWISGEHFSVYMQ